ncbi:hypothetical protein FJY68_08125 [candidate division WOR-3 bacterium]|uniref:Aminoacyl-transfer RNA synthetases class-II family profile domain-containing protein n=1 Tax=candidate division WOR-3 bacterium TaxID=2052148 RepID=A0A937XGU7_UNCW3|nr:hypothetical protein [candidate division WOR-3 bacterium]
MRSLDGMYDLLSDAGIFRRAPWRPLDVVWSEKGLMIKRLFTDMISAEFRANGYEEILLPAFIPDRLLSVEPAHYRDVHRLSYGLASDPECYLRATSECQFAALIAADPAPTSPRRLFQACAVYRRESPDESLPMLRCAEIDPFIEAMTFSGTSPTETERQVSVYESIFRRLCLPVDVVVRPPWDTFPEATQTVAFDMLIPGLGVVQVATVHDLGTSFARVFALRGRDGALLQHSSSGISGRALASALIVHSGGDRVLTPTCLSPTLVAYEPSVPEGLREAVSRCVGASRVSAWDAGAPSVCQAPIRIRVTPDGAAVMTTALGKHVTVPCRSVEHHIRPVLADYDEHLTTRAKRRLACGNGAHVFVADLPWCGQVTCLMPQVARHPRKQFMGCRRSPRQRGKCRHCGSGQQYTARLAVAV